MKQMLSIFLKIAREPVVSLYFSFIFLNEGKVLLQKLHKCEEYNKCK